MNQACLSCVNDCKSDILFVTCIEYDDGLKKEGVEETSEPKDELNRIISFLKDDGNDGHKLYAMCEIMAEGGRALTSIAESLEKIAKPPCQNCCKTAGEKIVGEDDKQDDNWCINLEAPCEHSLGNGKGCVKYPDGNGKCPKY